MTFDLDFWQRLLDPTQARKTLKFPQIPKTFDILLLPTSSPHARRSAPPRSSQRSHTLRAHFGPRTKGGPEPNGQRETEAARYKMDFGRRSCGFVRLPPSIAIDWSRAKKEARSARAEAPRRGWHFFGTIVRRMIRPWRIVCGALVEYWFSARVVMFLRRIFAENHRVRESKR